MAYLGPAIGPAAFEVGDEVRQVFVAADPAAQQAFTRSTQHPALGNQKWLADIYLLARQRLQRVGVERVQGGGYCTFSDPQHFFSYRRDGATGRMASLIWLDG
jgi:copper oxidase (laccase) domain-containing protein